MRLGFPALERRGSCSPLSCGGSLFFRAKTGRHPFRERKRGFLAPWQRAKGSAPFAFSKCEMGSPPALLWREGDKGASPARFSAKLGPRVPCSSRRSGCRVRPHFPVGAGEEVARVWHWKWWKGFRRQASEAWRSGGGEGKRRRWTDGCPVAARGWGGPSLRQGS